MDVRGLIRHDIWQPGGRRIYFYGDFEPPPAGYHARPIAEPEYEPKWDPQRAAWMLAPAGPRRRSSLSSAKDCPLCPSRADFSSEIPSSLFRIVVFDSRLVRLKPGRGASEVVVYTPEHDGSLASFNKRSIGHLVEVWRDRYEELASRPDVDYVFIFENRGEAAGGWPSHPHGEILGYPFIPPLAEVELRAARAHRQKRGCLQCALIAAERRAKERLLFIAGGIAAYVPSYARWPYETHVGPIEHCGDLNDLSRDQCVALGQALQRVVLAYDRLFSQPMPYMMAMHQRPTDGRPHPEAHLHVEFYPVMRAAGRLKFLAGGECGAGTFVSDGLPEEKAAELKRAL